MLNINITPITLKPGWVRVWACSNDVGAARNESNELPRDHPVILTLLGAIEAAMQIDAPDDWVVTP